MGDSYRNMKDIKLTCHLTQDFKENFGHFRSVDIENNISDYIDLKDKIYEVIKQKNNIFRY